MSDDASPARPPEYYRSDTSRLTWRECWRMAPSWKVLVLWFGKLTGQGLATPGGHRFPAPLSETLIPRELLSAASAKRLGALEKACAALGFGSPVFHTAKGSLLRTDTAACYLREDSGETVASLVYFRTLGVARIEHVYAVFFSRLQDGRQLITSNQPYRLLNPQPVQRLPGAGAAALFKAHLQRLADERAGGNPPVPTRSFDELAELHWQVERGSFDFHMARGFYTPMPPEQVEAELAQLRWEHRARTAAAPDAGDDAAAVLGALAKAERPASRASVVWLLLGSLALFVAADWWHWRPATLALVVAVLFVHETGHYLVMRAFGYRNVRMVFIPFFGAAVAGVDRHATGFQRIIVALAGPVPGIVIGLALGAASLFAEAGPLWRAAALMFIGLNGFNLLPLLPFDGGQVLNETVFCRHPWLRAGFRLLAGAGLVALGVHLGSSMILIGLGIATILTVGTVLRQGAVLKRLRSEGVSLTEPIPGREGEEVRPEAIPPLLTELRASHRAEVTPVTLVAEAVNVIREFRARPPSPLVSCGLLGLYVTACVVALMGFAVLTTPGVHSRWYPNRWALMRRMIHPQRVVNPPPAPATAESPSPPAQTDAPDR